MKLFFVKAFILFIKIIYAPLKLRKTKNKIVFLSRQSNQKSLDMSMLEQAIRDISPETEIVFRLCLFRDEKSVSLSYILHILGDMAAIADAKVCITDTYSIPLSCLNHKSELKIVQIWHALGAVKKFGLQSAGKKQGRNINIARVMRMHKNYDYVIAPSAAAAEFYKEAFGCTDRNIFIASLPRVDYITSVPSRKEEFTELNPNYQGKAVVLYLPTFRQGEQGFIDDIITAFKESDKALLVSPHPLSKVNVPSENAFTGDFSTWDLMKIADAIVTDYSASAYEAALLQKPLYFFVPDYQVYSTEQGLNMDPTEVMKRVTFSSAAFLFKAVCENEYDFETLERFINRYVENRGSGNTEKSARFICSLLK